LAAAAFSSVNAVSVFSALSDRGEREHGIPLAAAGSSLPPMSFFLITHQEAFAERPLEKPASWASFSVSICE